MSVVDADVPLLLGLDVQQRWGMIIDTSKKEIHLKKSNETFKINTSRSSHWTLPVKRKSLVEKAENLVFAVQLENLLER